MRFLFRALLLVSILSLVWMPLPSHACTCYADDGAGESITAYCIDVCGESTATEYEDGVCLCSTTTATKSCTDVCEEAGLSVDPPTSDTTEEVKTAIIPNLSVDIPGVSFSEVLNKDGVLTINFLGDYITGVYLYLIGISTTIAIVMIMIGGLQWAMSAGGSDLKAAKTRIQNAVMGLVLLLSVYAILFIINPNLTFFKGVQLEIIPEITESEDDVVSGTLATSFGKPSGSNISGGGISEVPAELVSEIEAVASAMNALGYGLSITSSFRTPAKQIELIEKNCNNPPGSSTCDPKPGRPTTCILKDLNPANCPHTTGRALDVWATKDGVQCITSSSCSKDPSTDACRANTCQAALITAMKDQGFCNLSSEAWHFEKPKMSSKCN